MNILLKLTAAASVASLAACQPLAPAQRAQPPVDPVPPQVTASGTAPQTPANSHAPQRPAQAQGQTQSAPIITLHLAQQKQEPSLVDVNVGGQAHLYALPQPVLTQADMARVSPVTSQQGNFLLLEMNQRGIPKLQRVTQQARGNFLLLSVRGQLVNVARIDHEVSDGRLLLATQNTQQTQAIIQLLRGNAQ